MKKRLLILALCSAALVAVFLFASPAPEVEAFECDRCRCLPTQTSASQTVGGPGWTGGASCAQANAQLHANLEASTSCGGDFCTSQLVITTPCQMDDPKWYPVTGHLVYSCELCINICQ